MVSLGRAAALADPCHVAGSSEFKHQITGLLPAPAAWRRPPSQLARCVRSLGTDETNRRLVRRRTPGWGQFGNRWDVMGKRQMDLETRRY